MNGELCKHDRVVGHVCLDCPSGTAEAPMRTGIDEIIEILDEMSVEDQERLLRLVNGIADSDLEEISVDELRCERVPTGLDAPYYDIPPEVTCIQDAIEYLGLNFAQGNILKSLWREHGPDTKVTDALYEAEKRYYFAGRELERVRRDHEMERRGKRLRAAAEESMLENEHIAHAFEEQ